MKPLSLLAGFAALHVLLVAGCTAGSSPEARVREMYAAMRGGDVDAMMALVEPSKRKDFADLPESQRKAMKEKLSGMLKEQAALIESFDIVRTEMKGDDRAVVWVRIKEKGKEPKEDDTNLVRIEGIWYLADGP